jgi:hypothetical protein
VMFYVLFMCKCVLPPGVNPIAVDKYINISISKPLIPSNKLPKQNMGGHKSDV